MPRQAILLPLFAQVALTFLLLFWMAALRVRALRSGRVEAQAVALRQPNWPPRAIQIANAFHNQLETPLLFYVVVLLSLITSTFDTILVVLAWIFVASRFVHAYVHVTSNRMDHRGPAFLVGALALLAMWIIVAVRVILAAPG